MLHPTVRAGLADEGNLNQSVEVQSNAYYASRSHSTMNHGMRRRAVTWSLSVGVPALLVGLATLPPFVGDEFRGILMVAFSFACHQIAERSPHLLDVQLAVCHRCYGIYVALPIAALSFPFAARWDRHFNKHAKYLLLGALLVPGIDWLGDVVGFWTNTSLSRLSTGAVFGAVAGYYLSRSIHEGMGSRPERKQVDSPSGRPEDVGTSHVLR